jgi:REP element-mobilizing transposase RayT
MPQSFASLHVHIVFSTKRRERWLNEELYPRLFEYIGGILRAHSCPLVAAGGAEDHIHLLTSLSRTNSVADVVRLVKSNSSGWIHEMLPDMSLFQWQQGYGAFAVSASNIEAVKAYCENQADHHRGRSFQDEFRELLRRHGLEWNERYVWD